MRYTLKRQKVQILRTARLLSCVVGFGLGSLGSLNAQTLYWLGVLEGGTASEAFDVSDNRVVVGTVYYSGGTTRAFRWVDNAMSAISTELAIGIEARGVSADGSVIVGWARFQGSNLSLGWKAHGKPWCTKYCIRYME